MAAKKTTRKLRRYRYRCRVNVPGKPRTRESIVFSAKSDATAKAYCLGLMMRYFPEGSKPVSLERIGPAPSRTAVKRATNTAPRRRAKKKTVARPAQRTNPVPTAAELRRAERAFERFTGQPADVLEQHLLPETGGAAWALGPVPEIHYIATRDGKTFEYVHKFRRQSRPLLASSSDGSQLLLLGGAFSVTDRGIVDDP